MGFQNLDFRTATCAPFAVTDMYGEILDLEEILSHLKEEIRTITDVVELHLTQELKDELKQFIKDNPKKAKVSSSGLARFLKLKYPEEFLFDNHGKSGRSRLHEIFGAKLVDTLKSWIEREKVMSDESDKYISSGWSRTANGNKPRNLAPSIDLSNANNNYSFIDVEGNLLILTMVVKGNWRKFFFETDERFNCVDKVSLPEIFFNEDKLRFGFPLGYVRQLPHFSDEYIIGVDVGVNNYATVSVINAKTNEVVETTNLSRLIHSLSNKVNKANVQVASLRKNYQFDEAALHRASNNNRKQSLAIEAAREVADLSAKYGNALVAVEDLSWVSNTMANGRWNRGEFINRLTDKVEINGGRVMRVSAYNTSQTCHKCGKKVTFFEWKYVMCNECGMTGDRDENAAINIAQRLIETGIFAKSCATRARSKSANIRQVNRLRKSKKFIDRTSTLRKTREKNKPTSKRVTRALTQFKKDFITRQVGEVNENINSFSSALDNTVTVASDVGFSASEQTCMIVKDSTKEKYLTKQQV